MLDNNYDPQQYWDKVGGVSINKMYSAFGTNVNDMCDYVGTLYYQNLTLDRNSFNDLFSHYNYIICY